MSFNMLAMLYMQAAQSKVKNRQAISPKSAKKCSNLGRRKLTQTSAHKQVANTLDTQTVKVEKICRVCGRDAAISIFDNTGDRNFVTEITTFARVEIKKNDSLPCHICIECLGLLNNALLFKRKCENMDIELKAKQNAMKHAGSKEPIIEKKKYIFVENDSHKGSSLYSNHNDTFGLLDEMKGGFVDCLKCNMCFMDKEEYDSHLPTCDQLRDKLLKNQQEMVQVEFPWLCDFCGKLFRKNIGLRNHRMTHTNELPFHCDQCPYRGRNKEILNIHTRVHTGERPYKCPHCPMAFINLSNRRRHQSVHETRQTHVCPICGKGLSTERSLNEHEQTVHHGLKPFECDICGKALPTKKAVAKHRLKVHKLKSRYANVSVYLRIDEQQKAKQHENVSQHIKQECVDD